MNTIRTKKTTSKIQNQKVREVSPIGEISSLKDLWKGEFEVSS